MNTATIFINLAMLLLLGYCINRVERQGTEEDKIANRNALAMTTKSVIFLATIQVFLQLINYLGYLTGFMSSLRLSNGGLTINLALLVLVYLSSFNYYKKSTEEQAKIKSSFFGQMFNKEN